jgi:hypothetical protein
VNLISVPWTADAASRGAGRTVRFSVPDCAESTTLAVPGGLLAVAQVPIGSSCDATREVAVDWTGPVDVHGRLGPFRQTNGNGIVPVLERLPAPPSLSPTPD